MEWNHFLQNNKEKLINLFDKQTTYTVTTDLLFPLTLQYLHLIYNERKN